jgi:hypothetical protein
MADITGNGRVTRALGVAGMVIGLAGGTFGLYSLLAPTQSINRIEDAVDRIEARIERMADDYNARISVIEGRLMGRTP